MRAFGFVLIVVAALGCSASPLQGDPGSGGTSGGGTTGTAGAGGSGGGSACVSLGECDCIKAAEAGQCAPIGTTCWCPFESGCGLDGACVCGGGEFLACQPASCPAVSCGAGALSAPDASGCGTCVGQDSCKAAIDRVTAACASTPFVGALAGAVCSRNPSCEAVCLGNLRSCAEINCTFCQACDCAAPATPLIDCLMACWN